jgi:hypothetical protein
MAIDISWLSAGLPLYVLIVVFVLIFAILKKTNILGGSNWINVILSLIFSFILISFTSPTNFVTYMVVASTVLITVAFVFLLTIYFIAQKPESLLKPLAWIFFAAGILIVIFALFAAFPQSNAYLPGGDESTGGAFLLSLKHFFQETATINTIIVIVAITLTTVVITRG